MEVGVNYMNILVANNYLHRIGGTEVYTYSIIEELKNRGLNVEYFTFKRGEVSEKIEENLNVKFKTRKSYDLIIANHNPVIKFLWKEGFIIQTCHGIFHDLEHPSLFADELVSISPEVQSHLFSLGFLSHLIPNGVNCKRFYPKVSLNEDLKTIVSLCQSDEANHILEKAAKEINAQLISINKFKNSRWNIEDTINEGDLVVGLGRSIYDAMACGRPVIVFDFRPYYSSGLGDGYLSDVNKILKSFQHNCSGRASKKSLSARDLIQEFKKYNKQDGNVMRNFAVQNLNIEYQVQRYLDIYKTSKRNKNIANKFAVKKALLSSYKFFRSKINV